MRRETNHNLRILLLALVVAFAPVQAAVSAIDMLDHGKAQTQHCQHDMAGQADHGDMGHGDCCQHDGTCADNCSSCTQCISGHAMLTGQIPSPARTAGRFDKLIHSLATGIFTQGAYRPPRFLS